MFASLQKRQILGRQSSTTRWHGLAAALLGLSLTSGCGQKGPLFIPGASSAPGPSGSAASAPIATNPATR